MDADFLKSLGYDDKTVKDIMSGDGSIRVNNNKRISTVSSGSLGLDYITKGFAKGQITELYGDEHSGKTTVAMLAAADLMKTNPEASVLYMDAENAFNWDYAESLGLDMNRLSLATGSYAESMMDVIRSCISKKAKTGEGFSMIILDSISALSSKVQIEGTSGDTHVGVVARKLNNWLNIINFDLDVSQIAMIVINSTYAKIGISFGNPNEIRGGKNLKLSKYLSIQMLKPTPIIVNNDKVGIYMRPKIEKNKNMDSVGFQCEIPLRLSPIEFRGVDRATELFDLGQLTGILTKEDGSPHEGSSSVFFRGEKIGRGKDNIIQSLWTDDDFRNNLEADVLKAIGE